MKRAVGKMGTLLFGINEELGIFFTLNCLQLWGLITAEPAVRIANYGNDSILLERFLTFQCDFFAVITLMSVCIIYTLHFGAGPETSKFGIDQHAGIIKPAAHHRKGHWIQIPDIAGINILYQPGQRANLPFLEGHLINLWFVG